MKPNLPFLIIALIATIGDFVVPFLLGKRYPNYSNLKDTISTLGTNKSPVKNQLSYSLITTGSLLLIFSIGHLLIFSEYTWKHILYLLGVIIFGAGSILAGIFPEDAKGEKETKSGKIHGISSGLGFLLLTINPLWMFLITESSSLKIFNMLFFILGFLTFIIFLNSGHNNKSGKYTGLWQRINLAILYIPLIVNYSVFSVKIIP